MTTLDDFYYQKVTNAETKEEKDKYIQQQTESWKGNQGLSEYGRIVETFSDFSKISFTEENPLNQNQLDKILGYNKKLGKSTSCMIAAIINAYASLFKSGVSGLQIMNALFDGNGNIMDFIGQEKNNKGQYSFYCRNLWNLSYSLAESMDTRAKDFIDYADSEDSTKVFLRPSEKSFGPYIENFKPNEFQKLITLSINWTNNKSKYTISGLVDYRNDFYKKTYQSQHYVFSINNSVIDSLPANRRQSAFYVTNSYYNLDLKRRY